MPNAIANNDIVAVNQVAARTAAQVNLPGRYALIDRQTSAPGREYACRATTMTPFGVTLIVPVRGAPEQWVKIEFEHIGEIGGTIVRLRPNGFDVQIVADDAARKRLSDKIKWVEKHNRNQVADQRAQGRFVPEDPFSTLIMPDGALLSCFVIDLSAKGAAISAHLTPEIGGMLVLGEILSRVVRHFPGGFALEFITEPELETLEAMALRR